MKKSLGSIFFKIFVILLFFIILGINDSIVPKSYARTYSEQEIEDFKNDFFDLPSLNLGNELIAKLNVIGITRIRETYDMLDDQDFENQWLEGYGRPGGGRRYEL